MNIENEGDTLVYEKGIKNDNNKPLWHLMPYEELEDICKVLTYGAKKYNEDNWKLVEKVRYISALMRHLVAYLKGEMTDKESGMSHLSHAACNILFLMWKEKQ